MKGKGIVDYIEAAVAEVSSLPPLAVARSRCYSSYQENIIRQGANRCYQLLLFVRSACLFCFSEFEFFSPGVQCLRL
jgi:hypothetical protein